MPQYLYYCKKCDDFGMSEEKNIKLLCSKCASKMIPLNCTIDEWNGMSAPEMEEVLESVVLQHDSISSRDKNSKYIRKQSFPAEKEKRSRKGLVVGAIFVALVIVIGIVFIFNAGGDKNEKNLIKAEKAINKGDYESADEYMNNLTELSDTESIKELFRQMGDLALKDKNWDAARSYYSRAGDRSNFGEVNKKEAIELYSDGRYMECYFLAKESMDNGVAGTTPGDLVKYINQCFDAAPDDFKKLADDYYNAGFYEEARYIYSNVVENFYGSDIDKFIGKLSAHNGTFVDDRNTNLVINSGNITLNGQTNRCLYVEGEHFDYYVLPDGKHLTAKGSDVWELDDHRYNRVSNNIDPENVKPDKPAIGMDKVAAMNTMWGEPQEINKHEYVWGTSEQWVFGNGRYAYFDDDTCTSVTDRE